MAAMQDTYMPPVNQASTGMLCITLALKYCAGNFLKAGLVICKKSHR